MREFVKNTNGEQIDFEDAVHHMDDEIREEIHRELAPCSAQEFFDAYCKAHLSIHNVKFDLTNY